MQRSEELFSASALRATCTAPPHALGPPLEALLAWMRAAPPSEVAARYASALASLRARLLAFEGGAAVCDDAVCGHSSRAISTQLDGARCVRAGCRGGKCSLQHEAASLHLWVEYVAALFDVDAAKKDKERQDPKVRVPGLPKEQEELFKAVSATVGDFLERCAYHFVPRAVFRYVGGLKR